MNFNPRSHERSDDGGYSKPKDTSISIHAPTRGATSWIITSWILAVFQSTLPREERQVFECLGVQTFEFQSTLPREERLLFLLSIEN